MKIVWYNMNSTDLFNLLYYHNYTVLIKTKQGPN